MFFAGIDWADDHHDVAVLDQQGHLVNSIRMAHSPAGLAHLKAFLLDIAGDPQQIPCFVEANHGLPPSSSLLLFSPLCCDGEGESGVFLFLVSAIDQ